MRVAFMGSDPIALPALRFLHHEWAQRAPLAAVFTQPDRKTGRGMKLRANPVKTWALTEGIPVYQPGRIDEEALSVVHHEAIDLVLVMAYGKLLPGAFLEQIPHGTYNLHASLLPRLRGASPIHTAVALGLEKTGVSLMRVVRKMDAGGVADAEPVSLESRDTSREVIAKLAAACVPLLRRCGDDLLEGRLEFREQEESEVTYCRIIEKTDAYLDFHAPANELANRVRAFTPWPGTSFPHDNQEIRIREAVAEVSKPGTPPPPGTVLKDEAGGLRIACGEGALRVLRLQRPGGQPLDTAAFLRGFDLPDGTVLLSRGMRALEGPRPFPYRKRAKPPVPDLGR